MYVVTFLIYVPVHTINRPVTDKNIFFGSNDNEISQETINIVPVFSIFNMETTEFLEQRQNESLKPINTTEYLTKYEKARILGIRAMQIANETVELFKEQVAEIYNINNVR